MKLRNIILVVQQKYWNLVQTDTDNFWGLGDILRGLADLHEFCLSNNLNCYADLTNHPIASFLDIDSSTKPPENLQYNCDSAPFILDIQQFITDNPNTETLCFFSNQIIRSPEMPYNFKTKQFIRNIFRPSSLIQIEISEWLKKLPSPFNILHFRVGDTDIVRNNSNEIINSIYSKVSKLYSVYSKKTMNPIVLSDSLYLRKKMAEDLQAFTINIGEIAHLGYHNNSDLIKNSLIEFFIATYAQKILGYTTYEGYFKVSGFVRMIGAIFDIQVKHMIEV